LYVVLVPLFLALVWRQWPRWFAWGASLLAAAGLFLLSGVGRLTLAPGDGLELAGAMLWALHVILIGRLASRVDVLRLALVQYLVCGLLSTVLGLGMEAHTLGLLLGETLTARQSLGCGLMLAGILLAQVRVLDSVWP